MKFILNLLILITLTIACSPKIGTLTWINEVTGREYTVKELKKLEKLDLSNKSKVLDISPIVKLAKLKKLDLSGTQVTDISPLKELKRLEKLKLKNIQITDISPLSELKHLKEIDLSGTKVEDISPFLKLKKLSILTIKNTKIGKNQGRQLTKALPECKVYHNSGLILSEIKEAVRWLKNSNYTATKLVEKRKGYERRVGVELTEEYVKNLKELNFNKTNFGSDISPIIAMKNLEKIYLGYHPIDNLKYLEELPKLSEIDIITYKIKDLTFLANIKSLKNIVLRNVETKDLSFLKSLSNLKELMIWERKVDDISALAELKQLEKLDFINVKLNDINPLKELKNLTRLNLSKSTVADVSALSELNNLKELYLNFTQVNNIEALNGLTNLKDLSLRNTKVSNIDPLLNLKNLKELNLTALPITMEDKKKLKAALPDCKMVSLLNYPTPEQPSTESAIDSLDRQLGKKTEVSGKKLFSNYGCKSCHFKNKGLNSRPFPSKQQLSSLNYESFKKITLKGKPGTAMTGKNIPENELNSIYQYLSNYSSNKGGIERKQYLRKPVVGRKAVVLKDHVVVRELPNTYSKKLAQFGKNFRVKVIQVGKKQTISNLGTHNWYFVNGKGYYYDRNKVSSYLGPVTGWVFGAFLEGK